MPFDQFWVQRLEDQGHNVSILPGNYQPNDPGALTADIFIVSSAIGSQDLFLTNLQQIPRQLNLNSIDLSSANDVEVSVLVAGNTGYEVGQDFLSFRADEDGDGSYETLLTEFLANDFQELQQVGGDEVFLETIFQEVTLSVPADFTTLRLQVDMFNSDSAEQIGVDAIRVTADGGATTLATENFEGGLGQLGYAAFGVGVDAPNQFFNLSNAEGVTPSIAFEDFEGDVWFGGSELDVAFGLSPTFRIDDSRPFITYEEGVFDELQMAPVSATGRSDGDAIVLRDADHPLAAGLEADEFGEVAIFDALQGITFLGATEELAEAVDVVAENLDGQAVIAVLEKGDMGLDGEPSPGQRIAIFPHDAGEGSLYTDNGLALLDAAVAYAIASTEAENVLGDCNSDGNLDAADLACVSTIEERDAVLTAIPTLAGDLNGDGEVAFADFLVLAENFGQALGYAEGNIDLVGDIAFADFLVLAENFGKTRADASAVPEPSGLILFAIGALLLGGFRRRAEDLCSGSV